MRPSTAVSQVFVLMAMLAVWSSSADSNADLINANVERTIDLSTNVVHITSALTVENTATTGTISSYTYIVEPAFVNQIAFVGAELSSTDKSAKDHDKRKLNVVKLSDGPKGAVYRVDFQTALAAGKSLKLSVELVLFGALRPYPAEITQAERQYALFAGNVYYYTLYATRKQSTSVLLASDKTESYTQLAPTSKSESTISYGPYETVRPYEQHELSVHAENNAPFLSVAHLERTIEVSHWGNVAVEETIDLHHTGAKLRGPFSRFDFMRRQGGAASVNALKTLLPPHAADVYYRDEIGNISTSNLRVPKASKSSDPVLLELRPRFPLFGGWKTHYTVGYNLPVYQCLFSKGSDFVLKMKLIDHIYDDQFIESATVRIILPEHSTNIELITPYQVDRKPNELHYTYLDTVGRPVVVINKKNAAESHVQDFQLRYKFNKIMILQEPLLVVGFFYALFVLVIFVVRLDFSISSQPSGHTKKE